MKAAEKWVLRNRTADFKGLSDRFNISEILIRLMVNRGVDTPEKISAYLGEDMGSLNSPYLLKDAKKAAELIVDRLRTGHSLRIVGDYDADGVISTYILYKTLRKISTNVDYVIPDRINDGYGINNSIIEKAAADGIDTILTCDNGISAAEQTLFAQEKNIMMIITDHHDVPFVINSEGNKEYVIPKAQAVVNPKQEDCPYPYKNICGAVVAYKVIGIIYEIMGYPMDEYVNLCQYAAIATVCDVMELLDENRIIVKHGLKLLEHTDNVGLSALIKECGIKNISAYHLGFVIGPCINASGRLESALKALELLLCEDEKKAGLISKNLKELNDRRKELTEEAFKKACVIAERFIEEKVNDKILVIYLPECHESIAGIVAGRIKERYARPVFVLTDGSESCKGSGRSIESYNMAEKMREYANLMLHFGGHPMAAGLSIRKENIEPFRNGLNESCGLAREELTNKVTIDIEMTAAFVNKGLVNELKLLEPFGTGNEKPKFAMRGIKVLRYSRIGKERKFIKLRLMDSCNVIFEAVCFRPCEEFEQYILERYGEDELYKMENGMDNSVSLSIIYEPKLDEFRGEEKVSINISNYR